MKNALREFEAEGINTTVPLHETIMNNADFIRGDLSTDYLDRLKILDIMEKEHIEKVKQNSSVAIAAVLLQSKLDGRKDDYSQNTNKKLNTRRWKSIGRGINGI
jgi:acetyl/propionyl-CoA carboxylase alpha subunit